MSEMEVYTYPVQNECMRWSNGTQAKLEFQSLPCL